MAEVQVADPTSDGTSNTSTSTRSNNNTMASRSLLEEQHKDVTEQLNALTDAIRLLTRSMSSTHTQQPETTNRNTQLQMQPEVALALDQLLQRWKLEQTGFPTLYNACTQLKESLHLTATEADQAIHDIHASRQALAEEKRLGCKMKKVLQRLCKENRDVRKQNARLGLEVKRCKAEKKMIVNSVRDYMTSTARTRSSTRGSTHTNSCEHAVEDGDGLELEHKEERGIDTSSAETSFGGSESSEAEAETVSVSVPGPVPVPVPPSPTSSCKSFVTDEGCATLFLSKKQRSIFSIFKNKSVRTAASASSSSSSSSSSKIQDIRFTNQSPGLQFLLVPQAQKGSSEEDADADADSNCF